MMYLLIADLFFSKYIFFGNKPQIVKQFGSTSATSGLIWVQSVFQRLLADNTTCHMQQNQDIYTCMVAKI